MEIDANVIERVLIGGNHLASSLIHAKCMPSEQDDYEQVCAEFGQPVADMWVAWLAIMDLRDAAYGTVDRAIAAECGR